METSATTQVDRAAGVLLGQACGDALGVPYEFGTPPAADEHAEMRWRTRPLRARRVE